MHAYRRVTYAHRCQIQAFLQVKVPISQIAPGVGFHKSTIYREISRNAGKLGYDAQRASQLARNRLLRCRRPHLIQGNVESLILYHLFNALSPQQISARCRREKVLIPSHQTIYAYISRYSREFRPFRRRYNRRGASRRRMKLHKALGKVSIDKRPAIANQRRRIGDWERDCMYGANGQQILVCTDRKSRFTKMARITEKSVSAVATLTNRLLRETKRRIHTVTNDNGPEFRYPDMIRAKVFYCHPRKPQQRGTVENTIGLLRQYITRKTNLETLTNNDIKCIENQLNYRPRKCLDYLTPYEVFYGKSVALAV